MSTTFGTDPEFLVKGPDGELAHLCGKIGGTKEKPKPIPGMPEGFAVQEDNVSVEFNVAPQTDARVMMRFATKMVEIISSKLFPEGYTPAIQCVGKFPLAMLDHPTTQVFGCSPDFDAYQQGLSIPGVDPEALIRDDVALRFAGGHIHIGHGHIGVLAPHFVYAQFADLFLGLPSVGLDGDKQEERRTLYGEAGRYRPTDYGIEYRTLSNYWLRHRSSYVGNRINAFGAFIAETDTVAALRSAYDQVPWPSVKDAINSEDEKEAKGILGYVSRRIAHLGVR